MKKANLKMAKGTSNNHKKSCGKNFPTAFLSS
jgi:hypothetical protein